jgi:hypothetical protein
LRSHRWSRHRLRFPGRNRARFLFPPHGRLRPGRRAGGNFPFPPCPRAEGILARQAPERNHHLWGLLEDRHLLLWLSELADIKKRCTCPPTGADVPPAARSSRWFCSIYSADFSTSDAPGSVEVVQADWENCR